MMPRLDALIFVTGLEDAFNFVCKLYRVVFVPEIFIMFVVVLLL